MMAEDRTSDILLRGWYGALLLVILDSFCCFTGNAKAADRLVQARDGLFQRGPGLQRLAKLGVGQVVFVTRLLYDDPHWYANIGYYCDDENHKAFAGNGKPDESCLYLLDTATGQVKILLDGKGGSVRDPKVHYDGRTILFSYRPSGTDCYHLYEIQIDGTGLRQITEGPFDDYEAAYLPDGDIVFVSTRSQRWVGCWLTQVGTLFRCNRSGGDIQPISFNNEHDNTPAVLHDGRIVFTRWEYVDRSQVGYHQLWAMSPDGADVTVYFGNQHHYPLYIDAKPIPGTDELLAIDSPGHGRSDHRGFVCTIVSKYGPDDDRGCQRIGRQGNFNDPTPIDKDNFVVASNKHIVVGTLSGDIVPALIYNGNANIHEPIPVVERPRERVLASQTDASDANGRMVLTDVYSGRNMEGVKKGDIKKLLVLEILPKPVNFSGGMDLTSWLGTFILERVLGTVPVEDDGSAYFEVPAGRPVFFVALDANDMSVKRMQSFTNVAPGETLGCVGCHEHRTATPAPLSGGALEAVKRLPSRIKPFVGLPDVLDFCRDIQPILNQHCVSCHSHERPDGHVVLTDGLGPEWSISYYTLLATKQVADGRNGKGNQKPRTIGSCASELLKKIDGSHYNVTLPPDQWRTIWLWLESGAPYAGTYAALRNGEDQKAAGYMFAALVRPAVLGQRCRKCHGGKAPPLPLPAISDQQRNQIVNAKGLAPHERIVRDDDYRFSPNVLLNLSDPEHSRLLLGPLPKDAGGWGTCEHRFSGTDDPEYAQLLYWINFSRDRLAKKPMFGMTDFKPNRQYVREMKRFGVLNDTFDLSHDPIDVFQTDQKYWELFWYRPDAGEKWLFLKNK